MSFDSSLFSSLGACTFRAMILHQRPLRTIYDILSLTNTTLLPARGPFEIKLSDLVKVSSGAGQKAEDKFAGSGDPLKQRLSRPRPSRILCRPEGRECVRRADWPVGTSISRPRPSHILGRAEARKWVHIVVQRLETSLSRPLPSRILAGH
jgi:hypothetical protein